MTNAKAYEAMSTTAKGYFDASVLSNPTSKASDIASAKFRIERMKSSCDHMRTAAILAAMEFETGSEKFEAMCTIALGYENRLRDYMEAVEGTATIAA